MTVNEAKRIIDHYYYHSSKAFVAFPMQIGNKSIISLKVVDSGLVQTRLVGNTTIYFLLDVMVCQERIEKGQIAALFIVPSQDFCKLGIPNLRI